MRRVLWGRGTVWASWKGRYVESRILRSHLVCSLNSFARIDESEQTKEPLTLSNACPDVLKTRHKIIA